MATIDLSRHATDFRKHYAGVRMKQGQVLTEEDFNEGERLDHEDMRRTRLDVIGATGTPDAGFTLAPTIVGGQADFGINPGTLYLGGLRLTLEAADETYTRQRDWLRMGASDLIPVPTAGTERYDLVWIEAWEQAVSAVEDSELFEVALAGPDTSARVRPMRRVRIARNIGSADCKAAWTKLVASWATLGTLSSDLELKSDAVLQVTYGPPGNPDDLCSPAVQGGYLGAENQAIRVQLTGSDTFIWGFDNAAPLYRVQVQTDPAGKRRIIKLLTEPKDQAHWPLANQVIELLPWSAVLPNRVKADGSLDRCEKLSELSGHLAVIDGSYIPNDKTLTIALADEVPAGYGQEWATRPDAAEIGDAAHPYLYMRLWNRGAEAPPINKVRSFTAGIAVALGNTGLSVTFKGTQFRTHDFWIIAARPATANQAIPWQLDADAGRPPHGYRIYCAPLAVVKWTPASGTVVDDCRQIFLPLTKIRGCCSYTVGDGVTSTGNFSKIQDAIKALPPSGGEVCVLAGMYNECVIIDAKKNITIHGCGERTLVQAELDAQGKAKGPVFTIQGGSTNIRIERMAITAFDQMPGILVPSGSQCVQLAFEHLYLTAGPRTAIEIMQGREIEIFGCHVLMRSQSGPWPGIFSAADDVLIERNVVVAEVSGHPTKIGTVIGLFDTIARGGIQLGGGSERVRVINNLIEGGIGNGITLGSLKKRGGNDGIIFIWVVNADDKCDPCKPGDVFVDETDPNGPRYESAGDLYDIWIVKNSILQMGLNGIGVVGFFNLSAVDHFITVNGLAIITNRIRGCLRRMLAPIPAAMINSMGYGGIQLADVHALVIRENFISNNGASHIEPVCGIYVLHGEGCEIAGNRILNNGAKNSEPARTAKGGARAGIYVAYVLAPIAPTKFGPKIVPEASGVPALSVHDNIVSQPLGQALYASALGPVRVVDNEFTSRGMIPGSINPTFIAGAVLIINLGLSDELYLQVLAFNAFGSMNITAQSTASGSIVEVPRPGLDDAFIGDRLANGNVMFNDNQCTLDLIEAGFGFSYTSILIISLDDISFMSNQCDCNLFDDFVISQAILLGASVRASDNRFKEGVLNAVLSAVTFGLAVNTTSLNQSTHCIWALAGTPLLVDDPNLVLFGPMGLPRDDCGSWFPRQRHHVPLAPITGR